MADTKEATDQIYIIYKKLSEMFPHVSLRYKSPRDFIEDLLFRSEAYSPNMFKFHYKFEVSDIQKNKLIEIIRILRMRDPFASVSNKYSNFLNLINQAIEHNNIELGTSSLGQLADELEVTENTLKNQEKRNQITIMVSIIGVILTLVFGTISLSSIIADKFSDNKIQDKEITTQKAIND